MLELNSKAKSIPKGTTGTYLHFLRHQISNNIGHWAILKEREGRNINVYLIQILNVKQGMYRYWDDSGNCKGHRIKTIDPVAIMTNDVQLVFLDTI